MYSFYEKNRQEKQLISDDIQAEKEKKEHTQNLLNKIDEQRNKDLPISPAQIGSSKIDNEKQAEDVGNEISPVEDQDDFEDKLEASDEYINPDKIDDFDDNLEKIEVEEMIQEKEVNLDTVEDRKLPKKEFQLFEISKIEWVNINDAEKYIRNYNIEKKKILIELNKLLKSYKLYI